MHRIPLEAHRHSATRRRKRRMCCTQPCLPSDRDGRAFLFGSDSDMAVSTLYTPEEDASAPTPPSQLQSLRSRAQSGERLSVDFESRRTEHLDATDSRLETINQRHSDRELTEDDIVLFRDFAVHDLGPKTGMRRPLKFTLSALRKFAQDFTAGRTMNVHHNGERQVGTTFGAQLVENEEVRGVQANWVAVDWYAPTLNASEQRMQDITDMETGVLRYTSIEFAGGDWEEQTMESEGGRDWFFRIDDNEGAGQERLEAEGIARVSLGAVRGAGSS